MPTTLLRAVHDPHIGDWDQWMHDGRMRGGSRGSPRFVHDHDHVHDEHHRHHDELAVPRHGHEHVHEERVHAHPHVPDLHHRHVHGA